MNEHRRRGRALDPTAHRSSTFSTPRFMSSTFRPLFAASAFAALLLAPATLRAQAAPSATTSAAADSLAFPRQFVNWVLTTQGDSAFAHAGPALRESMKSAEAINGMAGRIAARFGDAQGT